MATDTDYSNSSDYSEYTEYTDRPRKICFAILVHNRRDAVVDLMDNIRCYCPNSSIVLYNGGDDPKLCKDMGYKVCPTSRKLKYGVTAVYMLEIMEWLEEIDFRYDVLINLDSDVLFAREGFETYILNEMRDKEYLGVGTKIPDDDFYCLLQLRQEIDQWKPLLGEEPYRESFNVGQAYSRSLVQRFLNYKNLSLLRKNLRATRSFGIDELVFATMAERLGSKLHAYQEEVADTIRYRPHYPLDETILTLNEQDKCFMFHPIYREMANETRAFIREAMKREIQLNADVQERFVEEYLGEMPYMIRRSKYRGTRIEWLSASPDEGLQYWKSVSTNNKNVLYGPYSFGSGKVNFLSALESRFGNLEAVCRIDDSLLHYWRDEESGEWFGSEPFAHGVTGMHAFIESRYGNFEVAAPMIHGGIGHWWRNNDHPDYPWIFTGVIGEGEYDDVLLVQNDFNQLTAIARRNGRYQYFVRDDGSSWQWHGPYD